MRRTWLFVPSRPPVPSGDGRSCVRGGTGRRRGGGRPDGAIAGFWHGAPRRGKDAAMLVLVDQDGVLADMERNVYESLRRGRPDIPAVNPADRQEFYVVNDYPPEHRAAIQALIEAPGFYAAHPLMAGAKAALCGMLERGYDVRICTSPLIPWEHCVPEKFAWIEEHLGAEWLRRTVLTKDKTLVRGDVLIDDKPAIAGSYVPVFEHLVFDAPYNQSAGGRRITWDTWQEVLAAVERELEGGVVAERRAADGDGAGR